MPAVGPNGQAPRRSSRGLDETHHQSSEDIPVLMCQIVNPAGVKCWSKFISRKAFRTHLGHFHKAKSDVDLDLLSISVHDTKICKCHDNPFSEDRHYNQHVQRFFSEGNVDGDGDVHSAKEVFVCRMNNKAGGQCCHQFQSERQINKHLRDSHQIEEAKQGPHFDIAIETLECEYHPGKSYANVRDVNRHFRTCQRRNNIEVHGKSNIIVPIRGGSNPQTPPGSRSTTTDRESRKSSTPSSASTTTSDEDLDALYHQHRPHATRNG